ncbi:MAG: peptidoglycan DD-metalloendopeptidase family protein [Actinobacteria bacterium]|nr:peptidoglycan DD-metalloendopeptidase family protein [Actinomycetota bacterium]
MASPRTRGQTATLAALVAACLALASLGFSPVASADSELDHAKHELSEVRERIRARKARLDAIGKDLSRLATHIEANEMVLIDSERRIERIRREVAALEARAAELQQEIDRRSRDAYILGPGSSLEMMLSATSYDDLMDRLGYLSELTLRDSWLADELAGTQARLAANRLEVARLSLARTRVLDELAWQRKQMEKKFEQQRRLLGLLQVRKEQALAELSRIRPFAVCPVDGPHTFTSSFGAPRPDTDGKGTRKHQGNDIMSPSGTPVVAPFDGLAVTARNKLGGLAVKVFGDYGYVYNAHLSRYGALGQVETGTVIGYVGTSGNAQGTSPHDHFEWHPGNGPAVDPYNFLTLVC